MTPEPITAARIAVVGAGMAGLSCARRLADAGLAVTVFEQSRDLGGRMATWDNDGVSADHGAQHFRARDGRFLEQVRHWMDSGAVDTWRPRLAHGDGNGKVFIADTHPRYVGVPAMNAPARDLAGNLDIRQQCSVDAVEHAGDGWRLRAGDDDAPGTVYSHAVLAVPAPRATALLADAPRLAELAGGVVMKPCWAVMATFDRPLDVDFDAVGFGTGAVAWACRNNSKGRRPASETWVIHADSDWSAGHLEQAPGAVKRVLLDTFFARIEHPTRAPTALECHSWRHARAVAPLEAGCLYDPEKGIGACGDWTHGASNVESAYLSGLALATRVLRSD